MLIPSHQNTANKSFRDIWNMINKLLDICKSLKIQQAPNMKVTHTAAGTYIIIDPRASGTGNPVESKVVAARWL